MRIPDIPQKPTTRIDTSTAMFMVATAIFYDALELAPTAMMTVATGAAVAVGWVPFLGQLVGIGAIAAGIIIEWTLSVLIVVTASLHFFTWFQIQEVHLGFVNRFAVRRLVIWLICVLVESLPIPFISALPMLTVGTIASILLSWKEDRAVLHTWEKKLEKLEKLFGQFARMDDQRAHVALRSILNASKKDAVTHAKLKSKLQALERRYPQFQRETPVNTAAPKHRPAT